MPLAEWTGIILTRSPLRMVITTSTDCVARSASSGKSNFVGTNCADQSASSDQESGMAAVSSSPTSGSVHQSSHLKSSSLAIRMERVSVWSDPRRTVLACLSMSASTSRASDEISRG